MNYPRIYSLSTVGVIKHYINDYLFHSKRTDFVGPNGVGKSIISDILQMMFVYDKAVIKFGTDGIKKEERSINTLPYKSAFAYCIMNIEVSKDNFISIGIQINHNRKRSIIPFVITKEADISLSIEELTINKEKILFASHFTENIDDKIQLYDLQELANYLLDKYQLKLNSFNSNNDIKEYYTFLYNKNILPIDLANDKNLKAFAKVIQSFSKAKSLNLDSNRASQSLKEFLFEDSDDDIVEIFNKEKRNLEEILRAYKSLNNDIQILKEKRDTLLSIRSLESLYKREFKEYKIAEINQAYQSVAKLKDEENTNQRNYEHIKSQLSKNKELVNKLPRITERIRNSYDEVDRNLRSINNYSELQKELESLNKELTELKVLILPNIEDKWKTNIQDVDLTIRKPKDFKNYIEYSNQYFSKYDNLSQIKELRVKEIDSLTEFRHRLKLEQNRKQAIVNLLRGKNEDGLLGWYLNNLPALDDAQLQAVLHFATFNIEIIDNPENGLRIIDAQKLFSNFKYNKVDTGIWIEFGTLSEFIEYNSDAKLLETTVDKENSIQQFIEKQQREVDNISHQLLELQNVLDGNSYNQSLFDINFDTLIIDDSRIKELEIAISCLCKIEEKKKDLQYIITQKETEILDLRQSFKSKFDEPEVILKELEERRSIWRDRENKINKYSGTIDAGLYSLEKDFENTNKYLLTLSESINNEQKLFNQLHERYYNTFGENLNSFLANPNFEECEFNYNNAYEKYKTSYSSAINLHEETKNNKNVAVSLEISQMTYSFKALEQAWLGSIIKSTDDIVPYLEEANQQRISIADGMRDSMLKFFNKTVERYNKYKTQIQNINAFFSGRKISDRFYFKLDFSQNKQINIEHLHNLSYRVSETAKIGELQFGDSITDFVESFFKKQAKIKDVITIDKLLNPKTFFELSARLTDQEGVEVPGSTGETYSAIALLGIARLSIMQKEQRKGLRFMILEELGSLDATNFKTFPAIAEEFNYQIITMAPHVFNIGFSDSWYAHHLIKGNQDENINYIPSASFFNTIDTNEDLDIYLKRIKE